MSFRTSLLPAIDVIRKIPGPTILDLRPTRVQIIQRTWSGGLRGSGISSDPILTDNVWNVRYLNQREIASSGGRFEQGDVKVGPITPQYAATPLAPSGGGFTAAQLDPPVVTQGVEIIYTLSLQAGATGIAGDFQLIELRRDRAFRFEMVLRRRRTTP